MPLPDLQVGKSVLGPRTFLTVQEFIYYNCSAVCGSSVQWIYGRVNGDLLQEGLCHMLCNPGLLNAESLPLKQATADPYLHRRLKHRSGSVLPVSVQEYPVEVWVGGGLLQGCVH